MGVYLAEPIADTIAVCTTASMFYVYYRKLKAADLAEKENIVQIESEVVEEKTIQEEKRILNVLRILVDKLRTLFRI
jgi:hypothetical protein